MNRRSAFDILLDYPKKHGLPYDKSNSEKNFYLVPSDPVLKTKTVAFKKNNFFFFAYDSFGTRAQMSKTFTGLFGIIEMPQDFELHITKKEWIDRYLTFNKIKTDHPFIDKKLTFVSKNKRLAKGIITKKEVKYFFSISEFIKPLEIIIAFDYVPLVKELKGKMVVGIETNSWIHIESEVDKLLEVGELILSNIQKNVKR